jgi:hypothetical protein
MRETDGLKQLHDALLAHFPLVHALEDSDVIQELTSAEIGVDAQILGQIAQHAFDFSPAFFALSVVCANMDCAAAGPQNAREDTHQRRFARAVGSYQTKHAVGNVQVYIVEGMDSAAIDFVEAVNRYVHSENSPCANNDSSSAKRRAAA